MPNLTDVNVTNHTTNVQWAPVGATAAAAWVICNADAANQPPVGFMNNPAHQFTITGRVQYTREPFNRAGLSPDPGRTEAPHSYAFA
jgi:hypothetical protein